MTATVLIQEPDTFRELRSVRVRGESLSLATGTIERVAFIFAMRQEAQPLIDLLGLAPLRGGSSSEQPERYWKKVDQVEILVSLNGFDRKHCVDRVGTEPSILNAYRVCERFRPSLIVNAGTAGGFACRGAEIADIYLSDGEVMYHDHRIPLPGFEQYGNGSYPCLSMINLPTLLQAKVGIISTGNSLDICESDRQRIESFGAHVKDMEAAAVAQVAEDWSVPFLAIKAITDLVDSDEKTPEAFMQNFAQATTTLRETLVRLVEFLEVGRELVEF